MKQDVLRNVLPCFTIISQQDGSDVSRETSHDVLQDVSRCPGNFTWMGKKIFKSHVFVFPSYREGFGISLMEAAAMGVPSISSNITGCNEIIKDGYNGILIPSKSVSELFNAMEKLISDEDLLIELSSVSREFVISKYEQKKVWEDTLNSY